MLFNQKYILINSKSYIKKTKKMKFIRLINK